MPSLTLLSLFRPMCNYVLGLLILLDLKLQRKTWSMMYSDLLIYNCALYNIHNKAK